MLSKSKIKTVIIVLFFIGLLPVLAASLSSSVVVESFSLREDKMVDIVGEGTSLQPDGTNDAAFHLELRGTGVVSRIQVRNLKTGQLWDTEPSEGDNVLLVQDSERVILNKSGGGIPKLFFFFGMDLALWLNDIKLILAQDAKYQVTVTMIEGSEITQTTEVRQRIFETPKRRKEASSILSALSLGQSTENIVGGGERGILPGGNNDWHIVAKIQANGIITGFRVTNTVGARGEWNTLLSDQSSAPMIAITDSSRKLLSRPGVPVDIPIDGTRSFHLWLEDNGTLGQDSTRSQLIVSMSDGRILERAIVSSTQALYEVRILSADFLGISDHDFVNASNRPGGNLNADLRIDVTLSGTGSIVGIQVQDLENILNVWNTNPDNTQWLVGVTKQQEMRPLNRSDGSFRAELQGGESHLSLWFERKTPFPSSRRYKVTILLDDGRRIEAETGSSTASQGSGRTGSSRNNGSS